jgi:hypothetical protein
MSEAIPPLPRTPPWSGAQLKDRDNFTFAFIKGQAAFPAYQIGRGALLPGVKAAEA